MIQYNATYGLIFIQTYIRGTEDSVIPLGLCFWPHNDTFLFQYFPSLPLPSRHGTGWRSPRGRWECTRLLSLLTRGAFGSCNQSLLPLLWTHAAPVNFMDRTVQQLRSSSDKQLDYETPARPLSMKSSLFLLRRSILVPFVHFQIQNDLIHHRL